MMPERFRNFASFALNLTAAALCVCSQFIAHHPAQLGPDHAKLSGIKHPLPNEGYLQGL